MVGTDSGTTTVSGPFSRGKPHPRHYGTYPKILELYVRKEKVIRLETAIRKMTSFPAQRFGILNRGLLKAGMKADITIFDPKEVQDNSSYQSPHQFPTGIPYVVVNGKMVIDRGDYTGKKAGITLRKEN
jgi:dihydroorotase/N-acyl-D-amino-acid deacylase